MVSEAVRSDGRLSLAAGTRGFVIASLSGNGSRSGGGPPRHSSAPQSDPLKQGSSILSRFPAFSGSAAACGRGCARASLAASSGRPPAAARSPLPPVPVLGPERSQQHLSARAGALRLAFGVATVAGVGRAPVAPGTAGAAVAVAIFVLLSLLPRGAAVALLGVAGAAAFAAGVWAADRLGAATGREDDGRIVIDEVVGQLAHARAAPRRCPAGVSRSMRRARPLVTGFVAFRVFDMWKPGPVRLGRAALLGRPGRDDGRRRGRRVAAHSRSASGSPSLGGAR